MNLNALVKTLANRDATRAEANIQADVRQLLLTAPFNLQEEQLDTVVLESQAGGGRRIDIEVGAVVIEVKRDLRAGNVRENAIEQLKDYVQARQDQSGHRYAGIVTDGAEWRCYHLAANEVLEEVSSVLLNHVNPDIDGLIIWLEGVMATVRGVPPTPRDIKNRLGAGSSSHALDKATVAAFYSKFKSLPTVAMKRKLWARLLTTALGTQFEDRDELFVEHTLLVNSAQIIAHAVLGLPVESIGAASLLSGAKFDESGIHGVVEADFFNWIVEVPGGDKFVRTLAHRLARFDWSQVSSDVLKVLYESVIGAETRKKLGEYYTPDWLAEAIVSEMQRSPLTQRVLDPACGSGTFLFQAVRRYLAAAEASGMSVRDSLEGVTKHVLGMDIHPVAVTFARVTYLLAVGRERLGNPDRPILQIPVFLGDSLQWHQKKLDLMTAGKLVIQTTDERELFPSELVVPDSLLADAKVFDQLIKELAAKASKRASGSKVPSLSPIFQRLAIPKDSHDLITSTFKVMCRLHDEGRNHIWGYYIRNLARPVWLMKPENRVDTLVGNPPWLAFRHMSPAMQKSFKELSEDRSLWHGAKMATHQDLSALFVARSVQLYLKSGGAFGFVMPNAVIDRDQFKGFRAGHYPDEVEPTNVAFEKSWDLRRLRPHFFPRGSAVIFGARTGRAKRMPDSAEFWTGDVDIENDDWAHIQKAVRRRDERISEPSPEDASPYRSRFFQGAILVPRLLLLVQRKPAGPLGVPAGRFAVKSKRSVSEKKPWKNLPDLEGVVESEFVRPLYVSESILPFRCSDPSLTIVPWTNDRLISGSSEEIELYPGLAAWWKRAEQIWEENRSGDRLSLIGQIDFRNKLSQQFPIQDHRVVYAASGMHICAARVVERRAIIDSSLYWATARNESEALYLTAILNAPITTQLTRPLMSYGKDERHVHLHVWKMAIPEFDPLNEAHIELVSLGRQAESEIQSLELPEKVHFATVRKRLRKHLDSGPIGKALDEALKAILGKLQNA